ncbi:MAG: cation-transporting P-type ATPase [Gaiellaceae bacterium]
MTEASLPAASAGVIQAHTSSPEHLAVELGTDLARGLPQSVAAERLEQEGPNRLRRAERPAYLQLAARQLADPLVALLVVAAAISALIGEGIEAVAIAAIVVLNGILGFAQEVGAARAVLALRETLAPRATVIRDGLERELPAEELVQGDLVVVREGDRVPADARLVRAERLEIDESALTGESLPAAKSPDPVDENTSLAERSSMIFSATAVTRGHATALVTATGSHSEIGEIAGLTEAARPPTTPLQRRLRDLSRAMVLIGVVVTVVLAGGMLLRGSSLHEAFLVGVSVAVAAVPEGLAATVTIALALGARAMAARGAVVTRLAAVETLGNATVVASDKTGTLTQNRLRVAQMEPARGRAETDLVEAAALASAAALLEEAGTVRVVGDPVDGAIFLAAREHGLVLGLEPVAERPFDAERRRSASVYESNGAFRLVTKGAPEILLDPSNPEGARLAALAEVWASDGLRVLAVAERTLPGHVDPNDETLERDLLPVGLVALADPLRPTAREAIRSARDAGLEVEILTGDHPATAGAIARQLGIPDADVYARVTPAEKLRLVEALQAKGEVVAVTGDGINDSPALRQADVGVAMGLSGTEAAREASDLVLTDDDFTTIVAAVREGRAISDNVRKFVAFLVSANLGEVVLFAVAVLAGFGAPMTVVQVLLINILTDGLPAAALSRDPPDPDAMRRGPTRGKGLFPTCIWGALGALGVIVGAAALTAFLAGKALDPGAAQTMAFATIALAELLLVFSCRSLVLPAWQGGRNWYLVAGVASSAAILGAALYVPALRDPLATVALGPAELGIVAFCAAVPFAAVELTKLSFRRVR